MDPARTYDYLIRSRQCYMDAVRRLSLDEYLRHFAFGLGSIGSTVTHIMITEWYYVERLQGHAVPPYEQWRFHYEDPPSFALIEQAWSEQEQSVRACIVAQSDWTRLVSYLSFPDSNGRQHTISASASDFLNQIVLHEVHHRAQLMSMLRLASRGNPSLQDIDYSTLMFSREAVA